MLPLACTLLASLTPQEPGSPEPSIAQRLEALIAKTNALDSFYARYRARLQTPEGEPEEGSIELAYAAPDRGTIRAHVGTVECELLWLGERVYALLPNGEGEAAWKRAVLRPACEPIAAQRLLDEHFPAKSPEGKEHGGMMFGLTSAGKDQAEGFALNLTRLITRHSRLLEWLPRMKLVAAEMRIEGGELVWSSEGFRCRLSAETGFPVRMESEGKESRIELQLKELLLDEAPEADPFRVPEEALAAEEDPGLAASMDPNGPLMTRSRILSRVWGMLKFGERAWDDATRTSLVVVLGALHREMLAEQLGAWMERLAAHVEHIAEHVAREHSKSPPPEPGALEELARRAREPLEDALDRELEHYLEALSRSRSHFDDGLPHVELFDAEREAVRLAYNGLVREPLLAAFDEKVAAALGE